MKFVTRFVFLFLSYDMLKMNFECTIFSPLEIFCKAKKKMCKQMISSQGLCMYIVRPQQKDGSLITSIPSTKRYVKYLMFPFSPWHFFPFFPADYEKKNLIALLCMIHQKEGWNNLQNVTQFSMHHCPFFKTSGFESSLCVSLRPKSPAPNGWIVY